MLLSGSATKQYARKAYTFVTMPSSRGDAQGVKTFQEDASQMFISRTVQCTAMVNPLYSCSPNIWNAQGLLLY